MCFEFEALYWAKLAEEQERNRLAEEQKRKSAPAPREPEQDEAVPA